MLVSRGLLDWRRSSALLTAAALGAACGARSGLEEEALRFPGAAPCGVDADCGGDACVTYACREGFCAVSAERQCDDGDPCTTDACDPLTGACLATARTFDLDGDGHWGPLPGFEPGAVGACGDDCDDASAQARPGGAEICDGRDNDCNGAIDDLARWVPDPGAPIRLSSAEALQTMPGGVAHDGERFGAVYHEQQAHWQVLFRALEPTGATPLAPVTVTQVDSDAFSGPLRWLGSLYATAWEDRRDGDYEIYFNRLDPRGRKLGPDVRVADASNFSLHPDVLWDGEHYVVVWDDERDGEVRIYGRLLGYDGAPLGEEVPLSDLGLGTESPRLALARGALGMVFKTGDADRQGVAFRTVAPDLSTVGDLVELADDRAVEPAIAAAGRSFVVAWHTRSGRGPGPAIYGAVLSAEGALVVAPRRITSEALFARTKTWIALGDRLLLVWAADYGDGYDLYASLLDGNLDPIGAEQRLTDDPADTGSPSAAIGASGDVGVLFRDRREGPWQVYFKRLTCVWTP